MSKAKKGSAKDAMDKSARDANEGVPARRTEAVFRIAKSYLPSKADADSARKKTPYTGYRTVKDSRGAVTLPGASVDGVEKKAAKKKRGGR